MPIKFLTERNLPESNETEMSKIHVIIFGIYIVDKLIIIIFASLSSCVIMMQMIENEMI